MSDEKINISWDELKTVKVEKQLKQQQAVARNRKYAQMTSQDVKDSAPKKSQTLWYNPVFALAVFGFAGGFLAWSFGLALEQIPNPRERGEEVIRRVEQIRTNIAAAGESGMNVESAREEIASTIAAYQDNPYVHIYFDPNLPLDQKHKQLQALEDQQAWRNRLADFLAFGLCGLCVSACLSVAESVVDRNLHAAVINGSIGAVLGLAGGLAAMFAANWVYRRVAGADDQNALRHFMANAASWGALGCFIALAPGVMTRNFKRLLIGVLGGAIGGIIGGCLQGLIMLILDSSEFGKLMGLICIGAIAGVATGIIEQAARTGWLKVTSGLIAGKQFILYRNPTYLGSSPDCQIYLFRDPAVGRRHAAVHIEKGRFELENLPLGGVTLVNGQEATRRRLRNGDVIQMGGTSFLFQEKGK